MSEAAPLTTRDGEKAGRYWILIAGSGAILWCLNAAWLAMDTRPPVWDMALHQVYALHYLPGFPGTDGLAAWQLSGNYPPLVHIFIALVFSFFHPGSDAAAFVNVPATFLLLWSVFQLGRHFASPAAGAWACILVLLTPYLIWFSRETILDYWLSAWVAFAWVILIRTNGFESRFWSRIFGVVCAAGLLTKWLFAGFMVGPVFLVAVRYKIWKVSRRLSNAAQGLLLTIVLAGVWYAPNMPWLIQYFQANARIGALEGEPPVFSLQSLIYYLRLLEGYQLYGVLFVVLVAGIISVFSKRAFRDVGLWIVCISGGWLVMTLLRTKDPRFTMPLLVPLLLAPGAMIATLGRSLAGRVLRGGLLALLLFQAYATNFGVSWLPQQVTLLEGYQGSLRWDWQLFSQHYFNILGPPRTEDWKHREILARVREEARLRQAGVSLALVPDLAWFNTSTFLLAATLEKVPIHLGHLRNESVDLGTFNGFDFVITTQGDQGMPWTTANSPSINRFITDQKDIFVPAGSFELPNNDTAQLYFIDRAQTGR